MTKDQIVDIVINYVRNENEKYALLIDGVWGSGKTYLYENYLIDAIESAEIGKNVRKHNVYISLYGISSVDSLAKQLITSYLIYVKGNDKKIVKKGIKALSGFIGAISNAFSFSIGAVSADLSKILKKIDDNINIKDMVICFDDLERCTIPINEFFGIVNNLVEHCNCKVLILADEKNIGKIYANTNLEGKYLSVLSGNRKVVEYIEDEKNYKRQKKGLGTSQNGEITLDELKKLNEKVYSENYLYRDIKEKVIGKTLLYYPSLKEVITELINGTEKNTGIIQNGEYKDYLIKHMDLIESVFNETENRNLRIVRSWVLTFKKIYDVTTNYYSNNCYYEDVLGEFLRYSIWVSVALKKNRKITLSANYGSQNLVYFEDHEYTHIIRYRFIENWINREVWDDKDICQACNSIIKRKEKEQINNKPQERSTGVELAKLREWYLMEDEQVKEIIEKLEKEIKNGKYSYYDYSNILLALMEIQEKKLYVGSIDEIQSVMIGLIKNDIKIQEEPEFPTTFASSELENKYKKIYRPIAEERKRKNKEIKREDQSEADIYRNADAFYENCQKMEEYYSRHKSFIEYLDIDKLMDLISNSNVKDLYTISDAFKKVYYMGNLRDFYIGDIDGLILIREKILEKKQRGKAVLPDK